MCNVAEIWLYAAWSWQGHTESRRHSAESVLLWSEPEPLPVWSYTCNKHIHHASLTTSLRNFINRDFTWSWCCHLTQTFSYYSPGPWLPGSLPDRPLLDVQTTKTFCPGSQTASPSPVATSRPTAKQDSLSLKEGQEILKNPVRNSQILKNTPPHGAQPEATPPSPLGCVLVQQVENVFNNKGVFWIIKSLVAVFFVTLAEETISQPTGSLFHPSINKVIHTCT